MLIIQDFISKVLGKIFQIHLIVLMSTIQHATHITQYQIGVTFIAFLH